MAKTRSSSRSRTILVPHGSSDNEGSGSDDGIEDPNDNLEEVFLVEPRRSTTRVQKYTGTMDNQSWSDLLSATINAFAHFVAADSACEYLLADLQGMSRSPMRSLVLGLGH